MAKKPVFKDTREKGLDYLASFLPKSLGGDVVREKKKRKKILDKTNKKSGY